LPGLCGPGRGREPDIQNGKRFAVMFVRDRNRTGNEFSPALSDLLLRVLGTTLPETGETLA